MGNGEGKPARARLHSGKCLQNTCCALDGRARASAYRIGEHRADPPLRASRTKGWDSPFHVDRKRVRLGQARFDLDRKRNTRARAERPGSVPTPGRRTRQETLDGTREDAPTALRQRYPRGGKRCPVSRCIIVRIFPQ